MSQETDGSKIVEAAEQSATEAAEPPTTEPSEPRVPELARLHERHRGLTKPVSESYAEAAAVCLSRHHESPMLLKIGTDEQSACDYGLRWPTVTGLQQDAWANADDATRDGAYSVALGAVECHLGLFALARAKKRTGADYIVGPAGSEVNPDDGQLDLEAATRFEVSGIDRCDYPSDLWYRVRMKVTQTQKPKLMSPAIAGVVAFNIGCVAFGQP